MGKIVLPLVRPLVVTRLVLRTHQAVGTAAPIGRQVQVAAASPDGLLHVTPCSFGGLEGPRRALGIRQEATEVAAVRTRAHERARSSPIAGRL